MIARPSVLTVAIVLASCASVAPIADRPITPATAPAVTAPFTLAREGMLTLPAGWKLQKSGEGRYDLTVNDVRRGSVDDLDTSTLQEPEMHAFLDALEEAGTLTPELGRTLATGKLGSRISNGSDDVFGPQPVTLPSGLGIGFGYTTGKVTDGPFVPRYVAGLLDAPADRLLLVRWEMGSEVALVKQKNVGLAMNDAAREALNTWFKGYIESTPRTSLPWGNEAQLIDEMLMSYRR